MTVEDPGVDAGEQTQALEGGLVVDAGAPFDAGTAVVDAGPTSYPIKHIIVIVKENHTFDNYFGSFPGAEGTAVFHLSDGGMGQPGRAPDFTPRDLDHSHGAAITDWAGGRMNGWNLTNGSSCTQCGAAGSLRTVVTPPRSPSSKRRRRHCTLKNHHERSCSILSPLASERRVGGGTRNEVRSKREGYGGLPRWWPMPPTMPSKRTETSRVDSARQRPVAGKPSSSAAPLRCTSGSVPTWK